MEGANKIVFCEKNTGAPRFQVELDGDTDAALSRAASLLALGCMASGESPADYAVWVPAEGALIDRITKHAEELLHMGRSLSSAIDLSPREGEVLKELMNHRVNKEIADTLRISVRTVKFHVSSLLAKFGVGSRWDLIQKAGRMLCTKQLASSFARLQSAGSADQPAATHDAAPQQEPQSALESASASPPVSASAPAARERRDQRKQERIVPFRGRLRPA